MSIKWEIKAKTRKKKLLQKNEGKFDFFSQTCSATKNMLLANENCRIFQANNSIMGKIKAIFNWI